MAGIDEGGEIGDDLFIEAGEHLVRLAHILILGMAQKLGLTGDIDLTLLLRLQHMGGEVHGDRHEAGGGAGRPADAVQQGT